MPQVKLGDVAVESRETYKGDKAGMPIVGLEHLTPGEIALSSWDTDTDNTFTKRFCRGDMLFGRRRAYLKKAAQAPFDGVCSGDITVIRAKEERLLPELLPFIIQNDSLFDFAVGKSAGSLSPRVKWDNLKNYTLELPSMEEQRKLAQALWSVDDTLRAYRQLLAETDVLVQAQFVEMFGDPIKNPFGLETKTIGDITESILSGQCLNGDEKTLSSGQKAVLKVSAVTYGYFKADEYKVLRDCNQITKGLYPQAGDLLFSRANTKEYVGATALVTKDYSDLMLPDKLWKLVFKKGINTVYMKYFLSHPSTRETLSNMATGTSGSMYNISMQKLRTLKVLTPSFEQQNLFAQIANRAEQSKSALQNTITSLQATKRRILEDAFGTGRKE